MRWCAGPDSDRDSSSMNCDWQLDGEDDRGRKIFRCQREGCGNALYAAAAEFCHAECRLSCSHIGPRAGEILVECESCEGRVRIKHPAHHCAAFGERGRCLPTYRPADLAAWAARKPESEIYHLCAGCPKFSPVPP